MLPDKLADEVKTILQGFNIQCRETCARKTEPPGGDDLGPRREESPSGDGSALVRLPEYFVSRGLSQANVELAEERGLKPVFSFIVERTASLLQKWPILEPKIMSILRTRLWLALELLRRGEHLTGNSNPITVVITIEEESDLDLISVRDRIVKLLEGSDYAYVSVEIGQGTMNTGPEKNTRIWAQHASTLPALPGTIIAPWDPSKSTGIF